MPLPLARSGLIALLLAGAATAALAQGLAGRERSPSLPDAGRSPRPPARCAAGAEARRAGAQESVRKPVLDEFFERLAAAKDEEEADGIAGAIDGWFQRSGSDTADLLMSRALSALHRKENKTAVDVLDKLVVIEPQWAEAWSQRATARFMNGDRAGAVEDLGHALSREPRHFGALSGLGSILYNMGFEKRALEVFRRALAIRPHQSEVKQMIDKLAPGRWTAAISDARSPGGLSSSRGEEPARSADASVDSAPFVARWIARRRHARRHARVPQFSEPTKAMRTMLVAPGVPNGHARHDDDALARRWRSPRAKRDAAGAVGHVVDVAARPP